MNDIPSGTERLRPFLPASDFERSRRFYETIGFDKVLDADVAIFNTGSGGCDRSQRRTLARGAAPRGRRAGLARSARYVKSAAKPAVDGG